MVTSLLYLVCKCEVFWSWLDHAAISLFSV